MVERNNRPHNLEKGVMLGTSQISFALPRDSQTRLFETVVGHRQKPLLRKDTSVLQLPYGSSAVVLVKIPDAEKIRFLFEYIRRRHGPGGEATIRVLAGGKVKHTVDEKHPDGLLEMSGGVLYHLNPYEFSVVEVSGIVLSSRTEQFSK